MDAPPFLRERTRGLFFLYSDVREANTDTGAARERHDFWPLFTHRVDMNGNERLQILAPLEPFLPGNKGMERNYSPVWSLWRAENNPKTGARSQSLLWNLYRRDATAESSHCSLLFGLVQREKTSAGSRWRLFHLPRSESRIPENRKQHER